MSLRRTGIARKSELKRTPMAQRRRAIRRSRFIARRRDTGPTPAQRNLVLERAGGRCEICGIVLFIASTAGTRIYSFHHRQPRGMGGTARRDINSPANILLLCGSGTTHCHGTVERNRRVALEAGWLVHSAADPANSPVAISGQPAMVYLTHNGEYAERAA